MDSPGVWSGSSEGLSGSTTIVYVSNMKAIMKKFLLSLIALPMLAMGVTSCSDDNDSLPEVKMEVKISGGVPHRMLREEIALLLAENDKNQNSAPTEDFHLPKGTSRPYVIMVVGVNGVGKTTTIGKLGSRRAPALRRPVPRARLSASRGVFWSVLPSGSFCCADGLRLQQESC